MFDARDEAAHRASHGIAIEIIGRDGDCLHAFGA